MDVGDVVLVINDTYHREYFRNGDIGEVVESSGLAMLVDFSDTGNAVVQGKGRWWIATRCLKNLTEGGYIEER